MSWDQDQQFLARLMGPITALSAGALAPLPQAELLHGTTIGAFVVENGKKAVCFSDGKVSMGNTPVHMSYRKMMRLNRQTVLLFSGSPTLAVKFGRILRTWIRYREQTTNTQTNARGKDLNLANILLQGINLAHVGILLAPVMVTWDDNKECVRLFNYGPEGSMIEHTDTGFTTSGSGTMIKLRVQERWKPGLTLEEGLDMARKLIYGVPGRDEGVADLDSASGGKVSIDVVGPDGTETVQE